MSVVSVLYLCALRACPSLWLPEEGVGSPGPGISHYIGTWGSVLSLERYNPRITLENNPRRGLLRQGGSRAGEMAQGLRALTALQVLSSNPVTHGVAL